MGKAEYISVEELEMLSGIWFHVQARFGEEPEKESVRKQKRIYRWIQRTYGETIGEMSEKVSKYFLSAKNCGEILLFLQECSLQVEFSEDRRTDIRFYTGNSGSFAGTRIVSFLAGSFPKRGQSGIFAGRRRGCPSPVDVV